jgi:aldehyde:ferredoxin oxidoreductase
MLWFNKLVRINLTNKTIKEEYIEDEILHKYLGGKGLGTHYLIKEINPKINAYDPQNSIYIAPGLFSGTGVPASSRYHVVTKSPLTNIHVDGSSGGHFGPELKLCGIDLLVIEGKSPTLVGIRIENGKIEIVDAAFVKGFGIYDTEIKVREQFKNNRLHIVSIGLAGENKVSFACLGNDFSRNIGRGGIGGVFGSKNLKFITTFGNCDITPENPKLFMEKIKETENWIHSNGWVAGTREKGTVGNLSFIHDIGGLPTRNFSGEDFKEYNNLSHEVLKDKLVQRLSCANCPVSCSKGYRESTYVKGSIEGPEFETLTLMGANLGINDLEGIAAFNYLCNQYGIDTMTCGGILGIVFEDYRKGLLNLEDFGLKKEMSLVEVGIQLIKDIVFRIGIGDEMAKGSIPTAIALGHTADDAPQVKGLDIAGYEPRISTGMALAYQTSDRGACHLRSFPLGREISGVLKPQVVIEGKAEFVSNQQNAKATEECLGICQFPYGIGINGQCLIDLINVGTNLNFTKAELDLIGERIWNMNRLFAIANGIDRKLDYLPSKFSSKGLKHGPGKGNKITLEMQDKMLDEYYQLRGWDKNGIPTIKKIQDLGIMDELDLYKKYMSEEDCNE